ncbi:hypothetical protein I601_1113 [Nocardioides dokdonensis FR1436]|uniref:ABC-2 type transport system permease protein n=1 Tax=Nocardioides dokdonensis FR1436 TaxID=1300347 RepID=A0A1A9GJA7_9ACTN|nr:hypothetical protein [Nocardioides dokdonensis]ANH37555.1 hypothetical protein I601_1113 [Nocardioides dokdonensis FR1436]
MPTGRSWTDAARAVADTRALLAFRAGAVRRRAPFRLAVGVLALATLAVAVGPALVPGAGSSDRAFEVLVLLPTTLVALVLVAVVSAVASGGGRELIARDAAVVHPLSPTTDHLGALLLAPLNIAWLLQAWGLLGATAYAVGPERLLPAQVGVALWVALATSAAQVVAWCVETVRRLRHGPLLVRATTVGAIGAVLALQVTGSLVPVLDRVPTVRLVVALTGGADRDWALAVVSLTAAVLAAVVLGAVPAHLAARRAPRDELRLESGVHEARPLSRTVLGALVRTDRASVWRAVPMRRGLAVLAVGPGLVALLGALDWAQLVVLPGLVASGGALLFGVNAWCLDGRGGLWRESLPVRPDQVFLARAVVLAEFLLAASLTTIVLGGLRSGRPDAGEASALLAVLVVVTLQVVGASMRWSLQRPYAVDLRSARATPAPPLTMVGYSVRLALSTTVTGLLFSGLARLDDPAVCLLAAVPFACWSTARLLRTARRWSDPVERARVVVAVSA